MKLRAFCFVLTVAVFATPFGIEAFERTGVPWCDAMLDRYEQCLDSVTYERCEYIARREKRSAIYGLSHPLIFQMTENV
jgi:hypothetical protein